MNVLVRMITKDQSSDFQAGLDGIMAGLFIALGKHTAGFRSENLFENEASPVNQRHLHKHCGFAGNIHLTRSPNRSYHCNSSRATPYARSLLTYHDIKIGHFVTRLLQCGILLVPKIHSFGRQLLGISGVSIREKCLPAYSTQGERY